EGVGAVHTRPSRSIAHSSSAKVATATAIATASASGEPPPLNALAKLSAAVESAMHRSWNAPRQAGIKIGAGLAKIALRRRGRRRASVIRLGVALDDLDPARATCAHPAPVEDRRGRDGAAKRKQRIAAREIDEQRER